MAAKLTVGEKMYSFNAVDNLSIGGCSLNIEADVPEESECRLWIPLDSTNPGLGIDVSGVILRCSDDSLGIRFDTITPESLFHLQNLIRYNAPDPDRIDVEITQHPGLK